MSVYSVHPTVSGGGGEDQRLRSSRRNNLQQLKSLSALQVS